MASAREVASRLREGDRIEAAFVAAAQQTAYPESVSRQPYEVAGGEAGLAVVCSYLDGCFTEDGWDVIGHHHLRAAVRGAEDEGRPPIGLFSGLSGLAFAARQLSRHGTRYRKLLATIEQALLPQTTILADNLSGQKQGASVSQFDVISGLSGIGAYLLSRRDEPGPVETLRDILRCFVELTKYQDGIPRWHTPASFMWNDEVMLRQYPDGNLNCGMAHGIPGPLALLALAHLSGVSVEGVPAAIVRVAQWLSDNRLYDYWGVNWPTAVPLTSGEDSAEKKAGFNGTEQPPVTASSPPLSPSRTAWCYGSPGIARALWLAGEALGHQSYRDLAIAAMEAVYRRPLRARGIDSPTFCHGVAGLMQITLRFANDTGLPVFNEAAGALADQLLSLYDPQSLLGYKSIEPSGQGVDRPDLLDGSSGVALVLLAAATDNEPTWDRLFLLA
jgi:hypothetical protein